MAQATEVKTTGGNTNIDYNLRVKLGFPNGNINIDSNDRVELTQDTVLALLIDGLGLFIAKTYGQNIPSDLQAIINKLAAWYHY